MKEIRNPDGRLICRKSTGLKKDLAHKIMEQRKLTKQQFERQRTHMKTCWQRIYEILQEEHAMPDTFQYTTCLHIEYYSKARRGIASSPDVRTIVAITAGYDLGLSVTEELLKLAGHAFSPTSEEHNMYIFILTSMYGYGIDAKNELLMREGFKPLGTISREENDNSS